MKRPDVAVLCILLTGNALIWLPRVSESYSRSFDFETFHERVKEIFRDPSLRRHRFEQDDLLPDDYAYYESAAGDTGLLSIYVGYYPREGLLAGDPHDPAVCYPSFGWEVEEGPVVAALGDAEDPLYVSHIRVRRQGVRRIVVSWTQPGGGMPRSPGGRPPWHAELWNRLRSRRTDRAWIRLELNPSLVRLPLDESWRRLVRRTMVAAMQCLR